MDVDIMARNFENRTVRTIWIVTPVLLSLPSKNLCLCCWRGWWKVNEHCGSTDIYYVVVLLLYRPMVKILISIATITTTSSFERYHKWYHWVLYIVTCYTYVSMYDDLCLWIPDNDVYLICQLVIPKDHFARARIDWSRLLLSLCTRVYFI